MQRLSAQSEIVLRQELVYSLKAPFVSFRYSVVSSAIGEILQAQEESRDLPRQLLGGFHRPLQIVAHDLQDNLVFTARRSFFWLFSHMLVFDPQNELLGKIQRRMSLLKPHKYVISDSGGAPVLVVQDRLLSLGTWRILDSGNRVVGQLQLDMIPKGCRPGRKWLRDAIRGNLTFRFQWTEPPPHISWGPLLVAAIFTLGIDLIAEMSQGTHQQSQLI